MTNLKCRCCLQSFKTQESLEKHLQDAHWIGLSEKEIQKRLARMLDE